MFGKKSPKWISDRIRNLQGKSWAWHCQFSGRFSENQPRWFSTKQTHYVRKRLWAHKFRENNNFSAHFLRNKQTLIPILKRSSTRSFHVPFSKSNGHCCFKIFIRNILILKREEKEILSYRVCHNSQNGLWRKAWNQVFP